MFYLEKGILLTTFLWCVVVGVLHVTPKWRDKWGELIHKNHLMHLSIGIFVFLLGLLNLFLLLSLG